MVTSPSNPRKLVSIRRAARELDIFEQSLYRAIDRGTIQKAEGPDVPTGTWFEEEELKRWAGQRETLRKLGPRKFGGEHTQEISGRPAPVAT